MCAKDADELREILDFCQTYAISPGTHEENHKHEEAVWQIIREHFCHNSEDEVQALIHEHFEEVFEAMYEGD